MTAPATHVRLSDKDRANLQLLIDMGLAKTISGAISVAAGLAARWTKKYLKEPS